MHTELGNLPGLHLHASRDTCTKYSKTASLAAVFFYLFFIRKTQDEPLKVALEPEFNMFSQCHHTASL